MSKTGRGGYMARVVHFEIPADEPERAIEFYTKVFDWKIQKWGGDEDYWLLMTGSDGQPGINGGLMRRTAPYTGVTNSIDVPSVDEFMAKVWEGGGKVISSKITLPGVGYIAYCQDTEGNLFGIFQEAHTVQ